MKLLAWCSAGLVAWMLIVAMAIAGVAGSQQNLGGACGAVGQDLPHPSGHYSQEQIEQLWVAMHGPPDQAKIAGAVGMAESGGDPNIVNSIGAGGLMQIHPPEPNYLDPEANMRIAVRKYNESLSSRGNGWLPWEAYTNGRYLQWMHGGGETPSDPVVCSPGGTGVFGESSVVYDPREYADLPAWAMAGGRPPEQVDARLLIDAEAILQEYHLRVTAARETGHNTHGDGTALDMVPQIPYSWDATALRLAHDVGWTEACAVSGVAPTCPLEPWVRFVGYNGYAGHGDPEHVGGSAHIHVSWFASHYGAAALVPPNEWVRVFPVRQ